LKEGRRSRPDLELRVPHSKPSKTASPLERAIDPHVCRDPRACRFRALLDWGGACSWEPAAEGSRDEQMPPCVLIIFHHTHCLGNPLTTPKGSRLGLRSRRAYALPRGVRRHPSIHRATCPPRPSERARILTGQSGRAGPGVSSTLASGRAHPGTTACSAGHR
jgi:hypothetical protein